MVLLKLITLVTITLFLYVASSISIEINQGQLKYREIKNEGFINVGGFKMTQKLRYDHVDKQLEKLFYPEAQEKRSVSTLTSIPFQTQRDKMIALTAMLYVSYPYEDYSEGSDPEKVANGTTTWNDFIKPSLNVSDWSKVINFKGSRGSLNDDKTKGVQLVVFENDDLNVAVLSFRGSTVDMDYNQVGVWISDFVRDQLVKLSDARWVEFGGNLDEIDYTSGWMNYYYRFAVELRLPSIRKQHIEDLSKATGIDKDTIDKQGYYAVAKLLTEEVLQNIIPKNYTVYITGHSLGGSVASLISMYYAKKGVEYETMLLSPVGSRCIAKNMKEKDPSFDEIDYEKIHNHIITYVDPYDLIPLCDYQPGMVCYMQSLPNGRDESKKCFGKGLSLFLGSDWADCRRYTHIMLYNFYQMMGDWMDTQTGYSSVGCYESKLGDCSVKGTPATYVLFLIFHVILILIVLGGIGIGIFALSRYIYLRCQDRHHDEKIFWCSCSCRKCCRNPFKSEKDIEMYNYN